MTTLRSVSGNGVLRAAQSAVSPRTIDANAFGELSDAPTPIPGEVIGWDSLGVLTNIPIVGSYDVGSLPTPTLALVGARVIVKDTGDPSYFKVCLENSIGGYEWVDIAESS